MDAWLFRVLHFNLTVCRQYLQTTNDASGALRACRISRRYLPSERQKENKKLQDCIVLCPVVTHEGPETVLFCQINPMDPLFPKARVEWWKSSPFLCVCVQYWPSLSENIGHGLYGRVVKCLQWTGEECLSVGKYDSPCSLVTQGQQNLNAGVVFVAGNLQVVSLRFSLCPEQFRTSMLLIAFRFLISKKFFSAPVVW